MRQKIALPAPKPISDAARKRLEAKISEAKLDRDAVKAWCKAQFGVDHFADLTKEQYDATDSRVDFLSLPKADPQAPGGASAGEGVHPSSPPADSAPTDADVMADIDHWITKRKFQTASDLARGIKNAVQRELTIAKIQAAYDAVAAKG